jgi:hypothetical protein
MSDEPISLETALYRYMETDGGCDVTGAMGAVGCGMCRWCWGFKAMERALGRQTFEDPEPEPEPQPKKPLTFKEQAAAYVRRTSPRLGQEGL